MDQEEPPPPPPAPLEVLSRQSGATFTRWGSLFVIKSGDRVRPSEEYAMRLVRQYTSVPIPNPVSFEFKGQSVGEIRMSYVQGITLEICGFPWKTMQS
ncbi:hypothetical protein EJ08DRAFT_699228 [Tothia fuscella]|uniref:Uncharacterized protein n=1 Tax=Tothia fuscella TaxID=1048955 RepID=A0A9P4NNQ9_9PEZI|nr:hypothetical protein EJ08DRAFT_699228 [Tothia fuscella]